MKQLGYILFAFALFWGPALAQGTATDAVEVLKSSPLFPKYPTDEDRAALAQLEAATVEETTQALIAGLQSAERGSEEFHRVFAAYAMLSRADVKLGVARAMAGTAPQGMPDPFLQHLAIRGDEADIGRVIEGISLAPNGQGVALARTLAQRELPTVLPQLEALTATVPGSWADVVDLELKRPIGTLRQDYLKRLDSPLQQAPEVQE